MTTTTIGGTYADLAELKSWLKIPDSKTDRDTELSRRLVSASRDIDRWTHRQFGRDEVASARMYQPTRTGIETDDFWDVTGLAVVPYLAGVAGTGWDVSTLRLEPLNGIVDGLPGWPYSKLCSGYGGRDVHPLWANLWYSATLVQVTAVD